MFVDNFMIIESIYEELGVLLRVTSYSDNWASFCAGSDIGLPDIALAHAAAFYVRIYHEVEEGDIQDYCED